MIKIIIECETSDEAWEHLRVLFSEYEAAKKALFFCGDCDEQNFCRRNGCKYSPKIRQPLLRKEKKPEAFLNREAEPAPKKGACSYCGKEGKWQNPLTLTNIHAGKSCPIYLCDSCFDKYEKW